MKNVIPCPMFYKEKEGVWQLEQNLKISFPEKLAAVADFFIQQVKLLTGLKLERGEGGIELNLSEELGEEEYSIEIGESVKILSRGQKGAFYALWTLLQELLDKGVISYGTVKDKPLYAHRGLSLDVARHFFPKEEVKKIIEIMASVKLNVLHFHLSDDQGWRVQSEKYPLLNEIGSFRDATLVRRNGNKMVQGRYGGYYTKEDIKEIVDFAQQRFIDIMPEIDLPGHTIAVVASYPHLSCRGKKVPVRSIWGISEDILCAGNEQMYAVVKELLDELCELFPYQYFHLGGDEAPKQRWEECEKCNKKLNELGLKNMSQLQGYVFNIFAKHLEEKGKKVVGWNECLSDTLDKDIVVQHWTSWRLLRNGATIKAIKKGRQVIMSDFDSTYLDYPYARIPLKKVYDFNPRLKGVNKEDEKNILGVECNMWTEHVPDNYKLEFNLFPRVQAMACVAWGTNNDYGAFVNALQSYYKVLDAKNAVYAKGFEHKGSCFFKTAKFFLKDAYEEVDEQRNKV